jgi:hypothetical protein
MIPIIPSSVVLFNTRRSTKQVYSQTIISHLEILKEKDIHIIIFVSIRLPKNEETASDTYADIRIKEPLLASELA